MIYFNNIINNNKTFKTLVICLLSLNLVSAFFATSINIFKRLIKRDKEVLNISNFFRIKLREYVKNNI